MKKFLLLILSFLFISRSIFAQAQIPILQNYVNDYAGLLNKSEADSLELFLREYDKKTSNQIVILTIKSLDGYAIEEFSIEVAEKNKIGQINLDNGILILVAIQEKKIRIEVGYGLEDKITDLKAYEIIRKYIASNFSQKNYYEGFKTAIFEIIKTLESKENLSEQGSEFSTNKKEKFSLLQKIALFGIAGLILLAMTNKKGRKILGKIISAIFNILIILLYIIAFMITLSGGSGGGFASGGSRSGGFRGGGGRFGGGGASGGW